MNILMACAELAPLVRVHQVADTVAALARTLGRLGHRVTVVMPRYQAVDESRLMLARRLSPLHLETPRGAVQATQFDARLPGGGELTLLDIPDRFEALPGGEPEPADAERFGLFCRAAAALVEKSAAAGQGFDVVHAHDWPTALLPFLLAGSPVHTVLTAHQVAEQGRFDKAAVDLIGLDWDDFHPAALEFYGQLDFLKAGVLAADVVVVPSAAFRERLQQVDGGEGLDGVFRARGEQLVAVAQGVDVARYSPSTDPHIATHYDAEDPAGKARCKTTLLYELDLPLEPARPLLVAFGPHTREAGADLLEGALWDVVRTGARVVVAGSGEPELVERLARATDNLPGDALLLEQMSEPLRHRLLAAADAVLLPARAAPNSTVHRIAQRYGALPVARAVDAFADGIVDADAQGDTGTGVLFDEPSAAALSAAVARLVSAMQSGAAAGLRRRAMRLDVSWERPARRHVGLYKAP